MGKKGNEKFHLRCVQGPNSDKGHGMIQRDAQKKNCSICFCAHTLMLRQDLKFPCLHCKTENRVSSPWSDFYKLSCVRKVNVQTLSNTLVYADKASIAKNKSVQLKGRNLKLNWSKCVCWFVLCFGFTGLLRSGKQVTGYWWGSQGLWVFAYLGTNMTLCVGGNALCVCVCCWWVCIWCPSFYHLLFECFVHSMFSLLPRRKYIMGT